MLNEILGAAARYNALLTRKFNITGGAPAPQLTPEIGCDLTLELGPEGRFLVNEQLAYGFIDTTGAAGQRAGSMLSNPAGSNVILVVERVAVLPIGAAIGIYGGIIKPPTVHPIQPTAGNVGCRDTRVITNGGFYTRPPTGKITGATNTPATDVQANLFSTAGLATNYEVPIEKCAVVLAPGWALQIGCDTVATRFMSWFAWREVPLCPGEVGPF